MGSAFRLRPSWRCSSECAAAQSGKREGSVSQGFVYTKRGLNGGTFVAEPSTVDVQTHWETSLGLLLGAEAVSVDELLEAQDSLALHAVRLAARRSDDQALQQLENSLSSRGEANPSGRSWTAWSSSTSRSRRRPATGCSRWWLDRCSICCDSGAGARASRPHSGQLSGKIVESSSTPSCRGMEIQRPGSCEPTSDDSLPSMTKATRSPNPERGGGGADCWQRPPQRLPDPG